MSSIPPTLGSSASLPNFGSAAPVSEDRKMLEAAISRLSQENAKHREELEQLAAIIRLRAGQDDVACLKPAAALNKILDSRDDLAKKADLLTEVIGNIKLLLTSRGAQATREILDYVRKKLGGSK